MRRVAGKKIKGRGGKKIKSDSRIYTPEKERTEKKRYGGKQSDTIQSHAISKPDIFMTVFRRRERPALVLGQNKVGDSFYPREPSPSEFTSIA